MINVTFFGGTDDYFNDAFDSTLENLISSTRLDIASQSTGFITTFTGVGLVADASQQSGYRYEWQP